MTAAPLILLVDDYEDAIDIYFAYLTFKGYRVVVARNGQEAVDVARAHLPDVILLDLRMPALSGIEVIRILRQDRRFTRCPIIAFTAHALEAERLEALRAGFDEVIAKPCLPDQLAEAVGRILRSIESTNRVVLLATDVDDHARVYAAALEGAGFGVQLAHTGAEAIAMAGRLRPSCALIDLRLPDLSGWEVCRRIKAQPGTDHTRVVVLTQELTTEAAKGSVDVGCHAWLMQPTIADDVVEAVRDVLDSPIDRPASPADALLGVVECPACRSQNVRAGVRVAATQYLCCQLCRLCWRVESASAL
jgi:CheY-like chemotaxis protein